LGICFGYFKYIIGKKVIQIQKIALDSIVLGLQKRMITKKETIGVDDHG